MQRGTTLNQEVVVPKGSKVTDIAGLKGKKVGYVQNTTAHYFLYELLKQAGPELVRHRRQAAPAPTTGSPP